MAGNCVCVCICVCVQEKRPRPCGDRKSTGARKQTNKAQAAVIKSSLVPVMRRNAAERHTALSFLTGRGQSPELVGTPALCCSGCLPTSPLCFHLSWHTQGDECFGSILPRSRAPSADSGVAWYTFGTWLCNESALSKSSVRHACGFREMGQVARPKERKNWSHASWSTPKEIREQN